MNKRFERTEKFLNYLKKMEEMDFEMNPFYYNSALGNHRFMKRIIEGYNADKKYILNRLMIKSP